MKTTIYFIRHAQSHPSAKLFHSEWPLSELGRKQASKLALLIEYLEIQKMISSPFVRCLDTIKPFVTNSQVDVEVHDDLRERYIVDKLVDNFSEIWKKSWDDFHFSLPGCESSHQAQQRFSNAIELIVKKHRGSTLGISTHGNVLGLFLNHINPIFHIEEAETIRNPDVLKIIAHSDGYEWDRTFFIPGLDDLATDHKSTPIDKEC